MMYLNKRKLESGYKNKKAVVESARANRQFVMNASSMRMVSINIRTEYRVMCLNSEFIQRESIVWLGNFIITMVNWVLESNKCQ